MPNSEPIKPTINFDELRQDLRSGAPSQQTLLAINRLIDISDVEGMNHILVAYIKHGPRDRQEDIVRLAHTTDNAYFVEEALKGLSYAYYDSPTYRSLILHCLDWPHHDFVNSIELAAINRLPRYFALTPELRKVLAARLKSENAIVRDAVAEVVQAFAGVPDCKIWRTSGEGNLFSLLPPEMQKLLDT